jgi:hypothetical protein
LLSRVRAACADPRPHTDLIISYKEFRVTLSKVKSRLDDRARAIETLLVIQEIPTIAPDNSFTLDYDPVPKSIKIICGPFTWYARPTAALNYRDAKSPSPIRTFSNPSRRD